MVDFPNNVQVELKAPGGLEVSRFCDKALTAMRSGITSQIPDNHTGKKVAAFVLQIFALLVTLPLQLPLELIRFISQFIGNRQEGTFSVKWDGCKEPLVLKEKGLSRGMPANDFSEQITQALQAKLNEYTQAETILENGKKSILDDRQAMHDKALKALEDQKNGNNDTEINRKIQKEEDKFKEGNDALVKEFTKEMNKRTDIHSEVAVSTEAGDKRAKKILEILLGADETAK